MAPVRHGTKPLGRVPPPALLPTLPAKAPSWELVNRPRRRLAWRRNAPQAKGMPKDSALRLRSRPASVLPEPVSDWMHTSRPETHQKGEPAEPAFQKLRDCRRLDVGGLRSDSRIYSLSPVLGALASTALKQTRRSCVVRAPRNCRALQLGVKWSLEHQTPLRRRAPHPICTPQGNRKHKEAFSGHEVLISPFTAQAQPQLLKETKPCISAPPN